ncbi:MAG: hypothetical protein H0T47_10740 [Planctomycetaceae bacterium]|nr:hypothetical protein [Planctomycetaceae bacterium]
MLRPNGQLFELPPNYRWEVTRRHCYYLALREDALRHRRRERLPPLMTFATRTASLILAGIGVADALPDPATPYDELTGSVQPVTLRSLATLLLNTLPERELELVGHLFRSVVLPDNAIDGDDEHETLRRTEVMTQLDQVQIAALDSLPLTPLFHIHLGASGRTVTSDVERLLSEWRRRLGLPERRVPVQRLGDYLRVWDLREGWTGSGYDRAAELSLTEIARQLKASRSTVFSRYAEAFRMVTGHPFSPARWFQTFGLYKLNKWLSPSADCVTAPRRRTGDISSRPVPEGILAPPSKEGHRTGFIESLTAIGGKDEREVADLGMDLEDLTRRGFSDAAIAAELELEESDVVWLRERLCEF